MLPHRWVSASDVGAWVRCGRGVRPSRSSYNPAPMSEGDFALHPRLAADTAQVCDLDLSRVLLMDEAVWP